MLRLLTAGESHGRALLGNFRRLPAGLEIEEDKINQRTFTPTIRFMAEARV